MKLSHRSAAAAAAAALLAGGCGTDGGANNVAETNAAAAVEPGSGTVAVAIEADGDLGRTEEIARNAGLLELLGGTGPYTLFAPEDAAFAALGEGRAEELKGEALRPQAVALLRAHIVPGVVSRRDLEAALARGGTEPVQLRTMAGGMLTFSREGDAIVVSSADGVRAGLVEETLVSNGAVQRVDALLVPAQAPGG
jgi:uncharacterized surface protein with fasciclin (FAS1) repeats